MDSRKIAGLAIVRAHHRWRRDWTALITAMGWFLLLGGLARMSFPKGAQQQTGSGGAAVFGIQLALLAIGAFLTLQAFSKGKRRES